MYMIEEEEPIAVDVEVEVSQTEGNLVEKTDQVEGKVVEIETAKKCHK